MSVKDWADLIDSQIYHNYLVVDTAIASTQRIVSCKWNKCQIWYSTRVGSFPYVYKYFFLQINLSVLISSSKLLFFKKNPNIKIPTSKLPVYNQYQNLTVVLYNDFHLDINLG